MRRIIHNSTALAACFSLLAPHFAVAQVNLPDQAVPTARIAIFADDATPLVLAQADQRLTEEELRKEQRRQERAQRRDAKAEKDSQAKQAERPERRRDPGQNDEAKARKAEQKARQAAEREENAQERAARKADAERDRQAKKDRQRKEGANDRPSSRGEGGDGRRAEDRPRPKQVERPARAQNLTEKELAERLERRQKNEARNEDRPRARDAQKAAEQRAEDQRRREADARERDRLRERRAERRAVSIATSDTARQRAGNMPGLSNIAQREIAGGLTEERLACQSGGVAPCGASDRYVTPRGIVLERYQNGNYLLAPAEQQIYRVDEAGNVVARQAGGRAQRNEAAREAARETRAANAAALRDDRQRRRDIMEQRITNENRRSSSEDFRYNLRDALNRPNGNRTQQRADDDDGSSDLVKALLLGLGAVAVGSMLNNNRQVALSTPDRVVVTRPDGSQEVIKDETALLRQPGSTVTTEDFDDGSSRTIVTRPDGSKVVTIRDADLRILRRTLISADGRSTQLIDDTAEVAPVDIASLPAPAPQSSYGSSMDEAALRAALQRESAFDRRFTLGQIRNIPEVRALVAPVDIDAITFDTGSSAITAGQAGQLSSLGAVIGDAVAANPREMFLIEGHTDTVGPDAMNLALSDRRAESVALALTEYFDVPPENLVVQGYGEQDPKIRAEGDIRDNRRASVRRITDLLGTTDS